MLNGLNENHHGNNFSEFQMRAHRNSKKRRKEINMQHSFTMNYGIRRTSSLTRIFSHTTNGELIHDCYYDIFDSDNKIVFISNVNYVKVMEDKYQLTSCRRLYNEGSDKGIDIDWDLKYKNVDIGSRDPDYYKFVQETFDYYILF